MSPYPTSTTTAVLLIALEPSAPRARIEAALVLLGERVDTIDRAADAGMVTAAADRYEVVDQRIARLVVQQAGERELRMAHLSLACARTRRMTGYDGPSAFDAVAVVLGGRGAPPPGADDPGDDAASRLTTCERRVAELAATGLPARDIAAAAYLSQKTVEYHLTRVYRKLGVRSKSELAFAFGGLTERVAQD